MTVLYPDVPIFQTIRDCYSVIWERALQILLLTLLPFAFSVALYIGTEQLLILPWSPWMRAILVIASSLLLSAVIQPLYAISLFRLLLLGRLELFPNFSATALIRYRVIGFNVLKLLWYGLVPLVLVSALFWLLSDKFSVLWIEPIIANGMLGLCLLLLLRFSFVFPAAAVDAHYSLIDSWATTKGLNRKLAILGAATVLPPYATLWVFGWLYKKYLVMRIESANEFGDTILTAHFYTFAVVGTLLSFLIVVALVTAASIVFMIRTGWRPGAARVS